MEGWFHPGIVCVSGPLSAGVARLRLCQTGCFPSVIVWAYCAPERAWPTSTQRVRPREAYPLGLAGGSVARQPCHSSRRPPSVGDVGCGWRGARRLHGIFLQSRRVSTIAIHLGASETLTTGAQGRDACVFVCAHLGPW